MTASTPAAPRAFTDTANPGGFHHVPALDGIRGTALLLVLCYHLCSSNQWNGSFLLNFFSSIRLSMWIGVNLFFALSGFLITGILWDTLHKPNYFRNFYARRSLRIFPLYYGFLFLLFALTPVLHFQWNGWQWLYLTYTSNLALWSMGGLTLPHVNINHFWSLQVEEQFYLLWPLAVFHIRNLRRLIFTALAGCLAVLCVRSGLVLFSERLSNHYLTMSPTFSCVDNLLYGCILALLLRSSHRQRTFDLAPKVFALCAACVLFMAATDRGLRFFNSPIQQTLGASLIGIGSSALIAMALVPASKTARLFDVRLLRFFGKYSYGLYVYHYSLDMIFTVPLRSAILRHTHSRALAVLGGALVVGAIAVVVSLLSYHLYEKHFLKLKRLFSYRPTPNPLTPTQ